MTPLRPGSVGYYQRVVAGGAEDYYAGGEAPGRWIGGGCDALGLAGRVEQSDFAAVLHGVHPATGVPLTRARKRQGFDIQFAPAKSVSVLWGLADPGVSRVVQECHDEAVAAAIGWLESQAAVIAEWHRDAQRNEIVAASGFVGSAFDHRTSRSGDPQLHIHVIIANIAERDGQWRTLGRHPDLFAGRAGASALYDAEVRAQLSQRLGVEWSDAQYPEIVGVDQRLIAHFSSRRRELLAAVERRGLDPSSRSATVAAALSTRARKPSHAGGQREVEWSSGARDYGVTPDDNEGLSARWRQEVIDAGLPPLDLSEIILRAPAPQVTRAQVDELGARLAGPDGLTATQSSFSRRDAIAAFAGLPGVGAAQAIQLADEWLESEQVVSLGGYHGAPPRYTTPELVAREERLVAQAGEHVDAQVPVEIAEAVTSGLEPDDAEAVRRLVRSDYQLDCVRVRASTIRAWRLAGL